MKWLDKMTGKLAEKGATAVKKETKKAISDLLPTLLGIGGMILGIVIFKESVSEPETPSISHTSITTNNYFFREMSEDAIKRILEEGRHYGE